MPDTYPTVTAALTRRYLLLALLSGRCTLALAGQGPRVSDPHALLEEEADLARAMRACSLIEAAALELEITRPDLPVSRPDDDDDADRQPARKRKMARRVLPRILSKCDVMMLHFGGRWYHEKWRDTVADGWSKARDGLLAAGLVDDRRFTALDVVEDLMAPRYVFDRRGLRSEGRRVA